MAWWRALRTSCYLEAASLQLTLLLLSVTFNTVLVTIWYRKLCLAEIRHRVMIQKALSTRDTVCHIMIREALPCRDTVLSPCCDTESFVF